MKKCFKISLLLILIVVLSFGCGKEEKQNNANSNKNKVSDKTKVNNLSESYIKYAEIKGKKLEKLTELTENSDNYLLGMALIPFGMLDLAFVPASICGLEEAEAVRQMFLYENIKYKVEGNKCTVSYTAGGDNTTFVASYDNKTDSVTMDIYEDDQITMTSEYVKIKDGYASQVYTAADDNNYTLYQTMFQNDDIYTSIYDNVSKPLTIFKNNNLKSDFAKNGDYLYISIVNEEVNATVEGEIVNFNN